MLKEQKKDMKRSLNLLFCFLPVISKFKECFRITFRVLDPPELRHLISGTMNDSFPAGKFQMYHCYDRTGLNESDFLKLKEI